MAALAGNPFFVAAPALDHLRPTFAIGFFLARYPSARPAIESKELNVKIDCHGAVSNLRPPASLPLDLKLDALDRTTILAGNFYFYLFHILPFFILYLLSYLSI